MHHTHRLSFSGFFLLLAFLLFIDGPSEDEVSGQPAVWYLSTGRCSGFDAFVVTQSGVGLCRGSSHKAKVFRSIMWGVMNTPFFLSFFRPSQVDDLHVDGSPWSGVWRAECGVTCSFDDSSIDLFRHQKMRFTANRPDVAYQIVQTTIEISSM